MKMKADEFFALILAGVVSIACVVGAFLYLALICAIPIALIGGILWVVLWILRSFGIV